MNILKQQGIRSLTCVLLLAINLPVANAAQSWTLDNSIRRVLSVAPEYAASEQMIQLREDEQQQASLWPNPEIEIRADESMGLDDGSGGYDVNELRISQPIPVKRLNHQKNQAQASLLASQSKKMQQQLMLEHKTAMLYHQLQLEAALYELSQQRLKVAERFMREQHKNSNQLVRYLTPLEQKRLAILRESARQASTRAEGKLNEAASQFSILLNLQADQQTRPQLASLELMFEQLDLQALKQQLAQHPQLQLKQHQVDAAQAGVEVANASRYRDPTVNLFIERDRFNNQRETYSGISLSLELPLWNSNRREQSLARAELINARTEHELQLRELNSQLQQSFMHYAHLVEQQKAYRNQLLTPAEKMFELSRESFAAGEENILGLIDSHNSYFEIRAGYLEILAAIAQELAHLRYAAGLSLLGTADVSESSPGVVQ